MKRSVALCLIILLISGCAALQSYVERIKDNPLELRKPICAGFATVCEGVEGDDVCNEAIKLCNLVNFTVDNWKTLEELAEKVILPPAAMRPAVVTPEND